MKRIKALEEILYQDSIENKQKGKKIKVGIILRIAALQVQGVEGLETVPVGEKVKLRVYMYKRSAKIKM